MMDNEYNNVSFRLQSPIERHILPEMEGLPFPPKLALKVGLVLPAPLLRPEGGGSSLEGDLRTASKSEVVMSLL